MYSYVIFIFHSTKWLFLVQWITRAEGYLEILLVFGLMSDKQWLSGKYFESRRCWQAIYYHMATSYVAWHLLHGKIFVCSFYEYKLIVDVVLDTWPVVGSGFWLLPILPNLFVYRRSVATTCWISSRWFLTLFKMPSPPLLYGQRFQLYQRNIYLWCVHDNIKSDLCSFNQYCLHLLQSQFKISMFYTNVMWWEDSFFNNYDFVEVFTSLLCPYVLINRVKLMKKKEKNKTCWSFSFKSVKWN